MKAGWGFIVSGIIILAIGLVWLFLGMPSAEPGPQIPSPGSLLPTTNPTPVMTEVPTKVATTATPVVQTTVVPSADAVRLHVLDLAFGAGNANLERWSATQNNGRIVISVMANRDADVSLLEKAVQEFNTLSRTNQISTQIKDGSATGDIVIKFVPDSGMSAIPLNMSESLTNREFTKNGIPVAKITRGTIYINTDLKGDERDHMILRSLYYELGVVGDSDTYPDSLFYSGENTNTSLSTIDKEAIRTLYGIGFTPGMSATDVKNLLYLR